jgi:hypothetical protein
MILASLQPAYLPWLGFFEQIYRADVFVIYDDILYQGRDWRNKNHIKTAQGKFRLTVPVLRQRNQKISEARIDNTLNWRKAHWGAIRTAYGKAPFFDEHAPFFAGIYARAWDRLLDLDMELIRYICGAFGLTTPIHLSSETGVEREFAGSWDGRGDVKTLRILHLLRRFGADVFYEGNAGKNYVDVGLLRANGIAVEFQDYRHCEYRQMFGAFEPYCSAVDLLFNEGPRSLEILTAHSPRRTGDVARPPASSASAVS